MSAVVGLCKWERRRRRRRRGKKLKEPAVSLAVDFKASRTGDGISALPNPTGGGRGAEGRWDEGLHFINAPASLIRDREGGEEMGKR